MYACICVCEEEFYLAYRKIKTAYSEEDLSQRITQANRKINPMYHRQSMQSKKSTNAQTSGQNLKSKHYGEKTNQKQDRNDHNK